MPYLPYEEPGITTILCLTSFIFLLNICRYILDRLLYCGIIVEILIGIIWGLPVGGTAWLSLGTQDAIQSLGYLGLIGLVFEGGINTDLALLKKTVYISISVATVGLLMPIALSFLLLAFPFESHEGKLYPTPSAAFSAGASLCSTSLGTTFAILSSAGMQKTRAGVVLVAAAMMDDVVGLVMVNIVTTLGTGRTGGWPIARPIAASFGLLLVTLAIMPYVVGPIWKWITSTSQTGVPLAIGDSNDNLKNYAIRLLRQIPHRSFVLSISILIVFVTIASFIDASVLFAAFIAGGVVSFLWNIHQDDENEIASNGPSDMYDEYYKPMMNYVLVPFFFASIGFSIPITDMFRGSIVWKGVVYSILMMAAKGFVAIVIYFEWLSKVWQRKRTIFSRRKENANVAPTCNTRLSISEGEPNIPPHSIALLVGFAMVARGEIGFLIASLSQSSGTLGFKSNIPSSSPQSSGEDIFLVIVWAVVLCTIAGPVGVGIIVRRLKANDTRYPGWI